MRSALSILHILSLSLLLTVPLASYADEPKKEEKTAEEMELEKRLKAVGNYAKSSPAKQRALRSELFEATYNNPEKLLKVLGLDGYLEAKVGTDFGFTMTEAGYKKISESKEERAKFDSLMNTVLADDKNFNLFEGMGGKFESRVDGERTRCLYCEMHAIQENLKANKNPIAAVAKSNGAPGGDGGANGGGGAPPGAGGAGMGANGLLPPFLPMGSGMMGGMSGGGGSGSSGSSKSSSSSSGGGVPTLAAPSALPKLSLPKAPKEISSLVFVSSKAKAKSDSKKKSAADFLPDTIVPAVLPATETMEGPQAQKPASPEREVSSEPELAPGVGHNL